MSLVMEILEGLWNTHVYSHGMRVNLLGIPRPWKHSRQHSKKSIHNTIYRLHKKGLIDIKSGRWIINKAGKEYFENKNRLSIKFSSPFKLNSPKNLLLMFDIPEPKRSERNWLRSHLQIFQYIMVQKSVWVGPSPLPSKFIAHTKKIGLDSYIKTFKLSRPYQLNKK